VRRGPGDTETVRDLGDAATRVDDRCTDRAPQPAGGASPGRDLIDRLGERQPHTRRLDAAPPRLVPDD